MKISNNYKTIVSILIFIALLLVGIFYFVYKDIEKKGESISALSQQLEFLSNRQRYLLSTQKMIDNKSEDIDKIHNSIVRKDSDVEFIEGLEKLAKDNGLTISIDSLQIEDSQIKNDEITSLKLKAKTRGYWSGTYAFMSQLESMSYRVKLLRFGFVAELDNSATPLSKTTVWQGSFEIRVLKYK